MKTERTNLRRRMMPWGRGDDASELIIDYWRLSCPSGHVLTCTIYRAQGPGLIVRAGYPNNLLKSQRVADIDAARAVADEWRDSITSKGRFNVVPIAN